MPDMYSKQAVPTLSFLNSLDGSKISYIREERKINRAMLVEVAPPKKKLGINLTDNIEEIRQSLKVLEPLSEHWLNRSATRRDVEVGGASIHKSVFDGIKHGDSAVKAQEDRDHAKQFRKRSEVRQRVMSTPSQKPPYSSFFVMEKALPPMPDTLRTTHKSSDPSTVHGSAESLGPTHILLVVCPSEEIYSKYKEVNNPNAFRIIQRETLALKYYPELLEVPINELLFLMNVPNLESSKESGKLSPLPPPQAQELPVAKLCMPHLKTCRELVIYLHTKNQGALFRAVIPEHILDLMNPLPLRHSNVAPDTDVVSSGCGFPTFEVPRVRRLFRRLLPDTNDARDHEQNDNIFPLNEPVRSCESVAKDIAEVTDKDDTGDRNDPLIRARDNLTSLLDNLDQIGYYEKDLWNQLLAYQSIILRAHSLRQRI